MNNTTVGGYACMTTFDCISTLLIPNMVSLMVRLPVHAYILLVLLSRHWVASKLFQFNETVSELLVCLYDVFSIVTFYYKNCFMWNFAVFLQSFSFTQPFFLVLVCAERYVAVARPMLYYKFKSLSFNLALSGLSWLLSLVCCFGLFFTGTQAVGYIFTFLIFLCSWMKLYFCVGTLIVLKQPGPGDRLCQREELNRIKLKAFKIILVISVSVFLFYIPLVTFVALGGYINLLYYCYLFSVFYAGTAISALVRAMMFLKNCNGIPCVTWM